MSKKDDTQKDSQNKLEAGKNALNTALGNKAGGPEPKPKPEMGDQKADKSNSPKPKSGGGGGLDDLKQKLLQAVTDVMNEHLGKAMDGLMGKKGGANKSPTPQPGADKGAGAESKANMSKDSQPGKGPEPDATKGAGLDSKNPAGGMLKSAAPGKGPTAGAGGGPDVKDIVKKGM